MRMCGGLEDWRPTSRLRLAHTCQPPASVINIGCILCTKAQVFWVSYLNAQLVGLLVKEYSRTICMPSTQNTSHCYGQTPIEIPMFLLSAPILPQHQPYIFVLFLLYNSDCPMSSPIFPPCLLYIEPYIWTRCNHVYLVND